MPLAAYGVTHQGRRSSNEDAWLVDLNLGLLVVADGMGGHNAGEVASALAVKVIREVFVSSGDSSGEAVLVHAIQSANERILAAATEQPAHSGMGTTVVAVAIVDDHAFYTSVGDSRVYLWRERLLQQLTHDHSWVAEQVTMGLMSPAEARQHPWRNVVTRALSASEPPQVELWPLTLQQGDRLLISSDGLHGVINDERIGNVLDTHESLDRTCQQLIEDANGAGGPDNITTLILEIDVP